MNLTKTKDIHTVGLVGTAEVPALIKHKCLL